MQYRKYGKSGLEVSSLGMGCMRLPRIVNKNGEAVVDREKAWEMIRYASDNGINYFDTAYGYHNQTSEEILGEALEGPRREKVMIATKQPFPVMKDLKSGGGKTIQENARRNLENTLRKLRTSYIDVYLIHNINSSSWEETKQEKIIEEYEKFRSEGLIRTIGFSYHGDFTLFKEVLEFYDWGMCQMQQNLMDTKNEATEEGMRLAGKKGTALVIMEPLRGGGLASAPGRIRDIYDEYPVKPGEKPRSAVEWAFRHLLDYNEVSTILSGVTTLEQLKENIEIFSKPDAVPGCLTPDEKKIIARTREAYESLKGVPCTGCEYCLPCPEGVEIPGVFARYNETIMFGDPTQPSRSYWFMKKFKKDASLCAACGECEKKCPQSIEIIKNLKDAHKVLGNWVEY